MTSALRPEGQDLPSVPQQVAEPGFEFQSRDSPAMSREVPQRSEGLVGPLPSRPQVRTAALALAWVDPEVTLGPAVPEGQ